MEESESTATECESMTTANGVTTGLELDAARVQRPVHRIGNNIVIGAIYLDLESSGGLQEKTNREGLCREPSI